MDRAGLCRAAAGEVVEHAQLWLCGRSLSHPSGIPLLSPLSHSTVEEEPRHPVGVSFFADGFGSLGLPFSRATVVLFFGLLLSCVCGVTLDMGSSCLAHPIISGLVSWSIFPGCRYKLSNSLCLSGEWVWLGLGGHSYKTALPPVSAIA